MTEVQIGDVWASRSRKTTVTRIAEASPHRHRVYYVGTTGVEQNAWLDVYTRGRVLVQRDGAPVVQPAKRVTFADGLRLAATRHRIRATTGRLDAA